MNDRWIVPDSTDFRPVMTSPGIDRPLQRFNPTTDTDYGSIFGVYFKKYEGNLMKLISCNIYNLLLLIYLN